MSGWISTIFKGKLAGGKLWVVTKSKRFIFIMDHLKIQPELLLLFTSIIYTGKLPGSVLSTSSVYYIIVWMHVKTQLNAATRIITDTLRSTRFPDSLSWQTSPPIHPRLETTNKMIEIVFNDPHLTLQFVKTHPLMTSTQISPGHKSGSHWTWQISTATRPTHNSPLVSTSPGRSRPPSIG